METLPESSVECIHGGLLDRLDFVVNLFEKVGLAKSMAGDLKVRLDPVCEILTAVAEMFGIPFGLGRQTRAVIRVPLSV